jgi:NADH:ubiquinone oxidoreductase subunit E
MYSLISFAAEAMSASTPPSSAIIPALYEAAFWEGFVEAESNRALSSLLREISRDARALISLYRAPKFHPFFIQSDKRHFMPICDQGDKVKIF